METSELSFEHRRIELKAVYPFFGPANSNTLVTEIKREKSVEPTFPELVSFVHSFFKGESVHSSEIDRIMNKKYFVGFTGVLYLPDKNEVCFIDRPRFDRDSLVDTDNLLTRLRFDEDHLKISLDNIEAGSVQWDKVPGNPLALALCGGEEGAEKLSEIASKHRDKKCHFFIPKMSYFTSPQSRIPILYSYQDGKSLTVSLNGSGNSTNSYTLGLINPRG